MALITTQPAIRVVETDEGAVSLASIEELSDLAATHTKSIQQLDSEIEAVSRQQEAALEQAGWVLTVNESAWQPGDRAERIAVARGTGDLVLRLQASLADVQSRTHHGLGGVIGGLKDGHQAKIIEGQIASAQRELATRYRAVAEGLDRQSGIAEADSLLQQTKQLNAKVVELTSAKQASSSAVELLRAEIAHRNEVKAHLGFDALGVLADLSVVGVRPIQTDLVLRKKEVAALEVPATLCRHKTRTQYVGGSHGVSVPLGHGFRYRVSSFKGHPVQSEYLARMDTGKLVVTNQRLVFLGSKRDVSIPLAKLLQAEPYADAIGIAREGKETREIFLLSNPAYVILYLNWVIAHPTTG